MTLAEKRILFTRLLFEWGVMAPQVLGKDEALAFGEGLVALTDPRSTAGIHKKGGAHYTGVGHDMTLYRLGDDGKWHPVTDGDDPSWLRLGQLWEGMNPLCRWGGRFGDANHFSLEHGGVQ